jgi:CBS domain-containing membrane protein
MTYMPAMHRLRELTVGDVMNKQVVAVGARESMPEVAQFFLDHGISAAPVTEETGRFVGILSATDFLRRDKESRDNGLYRSPLSHGLEMRDCSADMACAYMPDAVQTVALHTPLVQAARIMATAHLHRLPVLDAEQRVAGMISTMDVTAAMVNLMDEWEASL